MVQASSKISSTRIAAAARRIIEGAIVDAGANRFSSTVFAANLTGGGVVERCAFKAAAMNDLGIVSLQSGRDASATPRRANVALTHEGARLEVRDCVLWSDSDEGRVVLVPWDARLDCHFAIGSAGLERRPGRPAALLGKGMTIARTRLERTARTLRAEELNPGVVILTDADAA